MFASKKSDVDDIHEYLLLKGVEAVATHGDKGKNCSLDFRHHSARVFYNPSKSLIIALDI